jgi:hypothetical protein
MTYKVIFSNGEFDDYFTVEGDSLKEILKNAKREEGRRGLTPIDNNIRLEEVVE